MKGTAKGTPTTLEELSGSVGRENGGEVIMELFYLITWYNGTLEWWRPGDHTFPSEKRIIWPMSVPVLHRLRPEVAGFSQWEQLWTMWSTNLWGHPRYLKSYTHQLTA